MKAYQTKHSLLLLLLCLSCTAGLLLQGCATIGSHFEKPTITASDLKISQIKALEAVFLLKLRVMNPNDFALDIRGLSCELNIEGSHFATGIGNDQLEIPAYGTQIVPVTVYASMIDVVGSVIQFLQGAGQQHPLQYELTGKVRLGGYGAVPFSSRGTLNLSGVDKTK